MAHLTSLGHNVPDGDRCDAFGNVLPVHAIATQPGEAIAPVAPISASPTATPTGDYIARGGMADAPAPAAPAVIQPSASHKRAVLQKLASTVSVSRALAACVVERADYENLYNANLEKIDLQGTIKAHRALIASETDFDVIQAAHEKLALLEAPSAAAVCGAICGAMRERQTPLCLATKALIEAAIKEIDNLAAQAAQDEATLFSRWGISKGVTDISRSIAAVKRDLIETQKAVKPMEPSPFTVGRAPHPSAFDHAINLFE